MANAGGHFMVFGGWLTPHIIHVEPYNRIYPRVPQSQRPPLASITTNVVLNFLQSPINDQKLHTGDFYCGPRLPQPHECLKANIPLSFAAFMVVTLFNINNIRIKSFLNSESAWGKICELD